jgi:DNA polymerase I-like protein with 3'-5' exonuclease and polymerase domains
MKKLIKSKGADKSNTITKKKSSALIKSKGDGWKLNLRQVDFEGRNGMQKGYIIDNSKDLKEFVHRLAKQPIIYFDCEFTSLACRASGKADFVGSSFSWGDSDDDYYLPVGHIEDNSAQLTMHQLVEALRPIWEDESKVFAGQNIKVDIHIFENYGLECKSSKWIDTLVGSWLYNENWEKGLKAMTKRVYDVVPIQYKELIATIPKEIKKLHGLKSNQNAPISLTTVEACAPYAIADAHWTKWHWVDWIEAGLRKEEMHKLFFSKWMPFLRVTYNMERRGVNLDIERLKAMEVEARKILDKLHYEMIEIAGVHFEPSSNQQVAELLFGFKKTATKKPKKKKGAPEEEVEEIGEAFFSGNREIVEASFKFKADKKNISDKTGQPSIGADILRAMLRAQYPTKRQEKDGKLLIRKLLQYSKISKINSTYITGLQLQVYPDGKLHTSYNVGGTDSGRISSSEPNLQNLVRPVEMADFSAVDYLQGGATREDLVAILKAFTIKYDDGGVPLKILPKTKLVTTKQKKLQSKFNYKAYNQALVEWRKANWFEILLKLLEIRDAFIPDDPTTECITAHDYQNLEVKILAHFSEDPKLIEAFLRGDDIHGATAKNMFALNCEVREVKKYFGALRQVGKVIGFLLIYGGGATTLYETLVDQEARDEEGNLITLDKAKEYYNLYFDTYSGIKTYVASQKAFAHKHGFVYTVLGRKRRLEEINSTNRAVSAYQERLSVNSPIQGCLPNKAQILTTKGYKAISELNPNVDSLVRYTTPTNNYKVWDSGVKQLYVLSTLTSTVKASKEHRFAVYSDGELIFKQLSDLIKGDFVANKWISPSMSKLELKIRDSLPKELVLDLFEVIYNSVNYVDEFTREEKSHISSFTKGGAGRESAINYLSRIPDPSAKKYLDLLNSCYFTQVVSVTPTKFKVATKDIEIFDTDHSYVVDDLLTHNSAGDIVMSAQIKLEDDVLLKELGWRQVLQIHDELVGICPQDVAEECCKRVKDIMEHPFSQDLIVPLGVDYDFAKTYAKAK